MNRRLLFAVGLLVFGFCVFGVRWVLRKKSQTKREANYQLILRSYSQVLKPGMTRKEVEDWLPANVSFRQICCVTTTAITLRSSYDDLTKIGEEDVAWFCSQHNVYVAFEFTDHNPRDPRSSEILKNDDLDRLKAVIQYPMLEGCL